MLNGEWGMGNGEGTDLLSIPHSSFSIISLAAPADR
jgi:hypothetical protein